MILLTADIGSTFTKLTAIDTDKEGVIATSASFTTIETDVMEGFRHALSKMEQQHGTIRYDKLLCCSSAAGGLKMVALGLVPELTAKAARLAAASAGAKVVKTYAFEISKAEQQEIEQINPDLVLLCGGTDGGNREVITTNARLLCNISGEFTTIVAGNKSASHEIEEIFTASGKSFVITENVMPEFNRLNIEPARKKIKELFIARIIEAKGLSHLQSLCEGDIIPTPLAVLNGCELLSKGTKQHRGTGDLMAVDLGGATTDVYSISDGKPTLENVTVKGLPEPFSKRTVEGDLGMRYSLKAMADELDVNTLAQDLGLNTEEVTQWIDRVVSQPDTLAEPGSTAVKIEEALAQKAVEMAIERHCGTYQPVFTPFGQVFALTGKDLSSVPYIVGIGGAIINAENPEKILEGARRKPNDTLFAKPINPEFRIDSKYIFASMGLLSSLYPDLAFKVLKREVLDKPVSNDN